VAAAWSGYVQASLAAEREQVFSAVAEVLAREVKRLDGERQEVARLALDELAEFDTLASRIARLEGRPGADAKGKALEEKWGRLGGPAS
jgi:hypothetical protein